MTIKTTPKAAAIYARISLDRSGEGLGVQRQEALCRKLAESKGWVVAEVYVDASTSAYNGVNRPEYERMLTDLEAGRRDAVLCVDLDRLTRRPAELESFIALADSLGIALANVSGDADLSTSDGRLKARILGAVARQESEKKAERVSREAEQAARRGIPRASHRPFGWEDDLTTVRTDEADLIREAVRRIMAGESAHSVAEDWNLRGIPTPRNGKLGWGASTVLRILRNPRLCGLRAYLGEIVAEGQWEPILDRAEWEALQGRIKRGSRPGRPSTHLLVGVARCGRCGGPLWTNWRTDHNGKRTARYVCTKRPGAPGCGSLAVVAEPLDALIRDAVLASLAGPALAKARAANAGDDAEQERAAQVLADAEARREEAASMYATGELSRREWGTVREVTESRIASATRTLNRHSGPLADLPADEKALAEAWEDGSVEWRRALVGAVVEAVTVVPAEKRGPGFDPDRVDITWRA